jgi:hypothetical protein
MVLQSESFPDESLKFKWNSQYSIQQHMQWTFMHLGHDLSVRYFIIIYYLKFVASMTPIFLSWSRRDGEGGAAWAFFTVNTLSVTVLEGETIYR